MLQNKKKRKKNKLRNKCLAQIQNKIHFHQFKMKKELT